MRCFPFQTMSQEPVSQVSNEKFKICEAALESDKYNFSHPLICSCFALTMSCFPFQTMHWSELIASKENVQEPMAQVSNEEKKRREAVWEVFQSECVFLVDHLMVLKHVSIAN